MKLPITDQFLWDMYSFFEKTDKVRSFIFARPYEKVNMLFDLKNPIFRKYKKEMGARKFSKLIYYLKINNIIKAKNLEGKKGVIITKKGFSKLMNASFKIETNVKRKDGKWIMIIFDIPKYRQKSRNLLRSVLKNLVYKILQHSVWVCPFDVSEKTEKLLQYYQLDQYVKVFLIEEL